MVDVAGLAVQSRALRRRPRWESLVVAAAFVLVGCGGRAASGRENEGGGGGSTAGQPTAGTTAMTGPETAPQAPNSVSLIGGDAVDDAAIADVTGLGPCFTGFSAVLDGMRVGITAFVQQPGEYSGDSTHILFAQATTADGRSYTATAGTVYVGAIVLHVSSVVPRFAGSVKLLLIDEAQPEAEPLELSLAFDVAWERRCGS